MITLDQARASGLSERQLRGMVDRGEWRRPYRAVFIDNSAPITPMQSVVAASFAVDGLASHRLCLWLWDLRPRRAPEVEEFCVAYGRSVRVQGVKIHRVKTMPQAFRRGIVPVTSPMRGLLDTAAVAPDIVQDAIGNHWILRYDWVDVVEDADRTAAEILEAYAARTTLPFGLARPRTV